ncbi:unnamed protein product [Bursaphelenchus okinawaensis]|uniref:Btz domain-containing protein n=1 Tax=Bursaphelenchus okinawaensis TaxID=465554 RepID=A0A811LNZ3_9BILA|nr:unnamed protein product [Bursaphelenchus okinawaensis]CAG9125048.1 unnamed protein product [Bursaphelenchus okinawaensis]
MRKESERRHQRPERRHFHGHRERDDKRVNDRRRDDRWKKKEDDKSLIKLDNPDLVPKAPRYFLHDNRIDYVPRKRFDKRFDSRRDGFTNHNGFNRRESRREDDRTRNPWTHDKYQELVDEEEGQ